MRHWLRRIISGGLLLAGAHFALAIDSGWNASSLVGAHNAPLLANSPGGWVRLRGIALPWQDANQRAVVATKAALQRMRSWGIRSCVMLRWDWLLIPASGAGKQVGKNQRYLPDDLRSAYRAGRELAKTYGDLVDAWEIDNEPDWGWGSESAETYAAFLKAMKLGVEAGTPKGTRPPLVVMASLALGPGPWLERFAANDGFSYTDAFNFHYYGYATDLGAHYRALENAVEGLVGPMQTQKAERTLRKDLPVFATEIGYALLAFPQWTEKKARVSQWEWFKAAWEQIASLGLEAPMPFYLPPFHESNGIEFGLTVRPTSWRAFDLYQRREWTAGGHRFGPLDFGSRRPEPWMNLIGTKLGENEASPALAWWLRGRAPGANPRTWPVRVSQPSSVVIDMLVHEGISPQLRSNGYMVESPNGVGQVDFVLYNFGDQAIRGELNLPDWIKTQSMPAELSLAPHERRIVSAQIHLDVSRYVPNRALVKFTGEGGVTAKFETAFLPYFAGRFVAEAVSLTPEAVDRSFWKDIPAGRSLAPEEPPLSQHGSVWANRGVEVVWAKDVLKVKVNQLPEHEKRRVMIEIPWPNEWNLSDDHFLRVRFRTSKVQPRASKWPQSDSLLVQIRTRNGNLYGVSPFRPITEQWGYFWEPVTNFTMWFYGRSCLPWRLVDNQPVALVLIIDPVVLPAEYEFCNLGLVTLAPKTSN